MKNILITGHKGFVGTAYHNYFRSENVFGVDIQDELRPLDCRDFFRNYEQHFNHDYKWDLVIHLAAIIGGRSTIENNPLIVATDLSIDAEFFNWAAKYKPGRVIYFSSSAAYPIGLQNIQPYVNLSEGHIDLKFPGRPDMTYGWSKLTGEMLAQFLIKLGVPVHVFRPFSGYGETQNLDYPFPSIIRRVKNKETPLTVWGPGDQCRDFIHIDDIVNGTMAAIERNISGPVNLGTGVATSFRQLARLAATMAGYEPEIITQPDKPTGVKYRVANVTKLNTFYTPKITLEEGITRALKYV